MIVATGTPGAVHGRQPALPVPLVRRKAGPVTPPIKPGPEYTCAVWYVAWHWPEYELFEDEQSAARFAANLEDNESGSVVGAQFSDGRLIEREEWAAYKAEDERRMQEWRERAAQAAVAQPALKRKIRPPFGLEEIEVGLGEPDWLDAGRGA